VRPAGWLSGRHGSGGAGEGRGMVATTGPRAARGLRFASAFAREAATSRFARYRIFWARLIAGCLPSRSVSPFSANISWQHASRLHPHRMQRRERRDASASTERAASAGHLFRGWRSPPLLCRSRPFRYSPASGLWSSGGQGTSCATSCPPSCIGREIMSELALAA
jgi:hypothetical protein